MASMSSLTLMQRHELAVIIDDKWIDVTEYFNYELENEDGKAERGCLNDAVAFETFTDDNYHHAESLLEIMARERYPAQNAYKGFKKVMKDRLNRIARAFEGVDLGPRFNKEVFDLNRQIYREKHFKINIEE
jgi:hypothetical protein